MNVKESFLFVFSLNAPPFPEISDRIRLERIVASIMKISKILEQKMGKAAFFLFGISSL